MEITRNDAEGRYAAVSDDGAQAGELTFEVDDGVTRLLHTAVGDEFEGQGVGSALARRALDDARRDGVRVDPKCGFVASYIQRHPEYAGLVTTA
ncbi:MAG TPA: GNAT family N-acetyltransferase [Egicoccus sp.]|nr:GNAT family N-acetyltransferase [Egicoccus sp.]HSK25096.1 GNAT family N-acetyltransferase [Egicoccus sp.]